MSAYCPCRSLCPARPCLSQTFSVHIVPAGAQGGALDACGLAATELTVVSVCTLVLVVRCQCLYLQSLILLERRGALLSGRTACCATQQTPACPALSAAQASRSSTAPAVSSLVSFLLREHPVRLAHTSKPDLPRLLLLQAHLVEQARLNLPAQLPARSWAAPAPPTAALQAASSSPPAARPARPAHSRQAATLPALRARPAASARPAAPQPHPAV